MSDVNVDDVTVRAAYEAYREAIRAVLAGATRDSIREWVNLSPDVQRAWRRAVETAICRWEHVA